MYDKLFNGIDPDILHRLDLLKKLGTSGIHGEEIKEAYEKYASLPDGPTTYVEGVKDFFESIDNSESNIPFIFYQYFLVLFRDTAQKCPDVSKAFINSMIRDFPGTKHTAIYPKLESLMESSKAFNLCAHSNDFSLIAKQSKEMMRSLNEFINSLLGYFIIGWRCAKGNKYKPSTLTNNYGVKYNEFKDLTNGEDGLYYLFFRLGDYHLRNAIAHDNIYFDPEKQIVKYRDEDKEFEMDIPKYMSILYAGSYLPHAYLASISTIMIILHGSEDDKKVIPQQIIKLLYTKPPTGDDK